MAEWRLRHNLWRIGTILLAPRGEQAYRGSHEFHDRHLSHSGSAAIVGLRAAADATTFLFGFSLAIGLVLVPAGAGESPTWQTGQCSRRHSSVLLFSPRATNQMSLTTLAFYNVAAAAVAGSGSAGALISPAAAVAFGIVGPSASQSHFTGSPAPRDGQYFSVIRRAQGRVYSRLSVLGPVSAAPFSALTPGSAAVGCEIIRLREHLSTVSILARVLTEALEALAGGSSAAAVATANLMRAHGAPRTASAACRVARDLGGATETPRSVVSCREVSHGSRPIDLLHETGSSAAGLRPTVRRPLPEHDDIRRVGGHGAAASVFVARSLCWMGLSVLLPAARRRDLLHALVGKGVPARWPA